MNKNTTRLMDNDIVYMCYRKCVLDIATPQLTPAEQVCYSRCVFKFLDTLEYSNKVIDLIEQKVAKNEQTQQ